MIRKSPLKFFLLSVVLIALDQGVKMAVHHYMQPGFAGQIRLLGDWLKLHYTLNPGMAFGMQLTHEYGKLFLSLFRLVAMVGIGAYIVQLARRGAPDGLLWALASILAGAVGNVIDSTFYGVLLDNAPYGSPTPWFHGQVIDMIFVDVWEGFIPEWVPLWGGDYYSTPIFNVADACIFVGVCIILLFQRRYFNEQQTEQLPDHIDATESSVAPVEETNRSAGAVAPSTDMLPTNGHYQTGEPVASTEETDNVAPTTSGDVASHAPEPRPDTTL